ncbi:MAG: NUDIX hydrolase [Phycisphaerales bacterium]|nr:NUDIX hydrolase [Phycisphaerales bacterium]
MNEGWSISDRSEAFRAFRWTVERSMRRRDGLPEMHEFFTVRVPDFVHVFPVTSQGEIILVRQFRHGIEAPTIEPPGGLVDPGDPDPAAAARREMIEETGYDAPDIRPIGMIHPNPALLTNRAFFFVAERARRLQETRLEATEDIRLLTLPVDDIDRAIADGRITNALIIAGLKLLDLHRRG